MKDASDRHKKPGTGSDYHSLLSLHHGLQVGRRLRGAPTLQARVTQDDPAARAPTPDSWPERADDQRLLRESLTVLVPLEDTLLHFYTALFQYRPHLRALFPGSIMAQRDRLTIAFHRFIDGLDDPHAMVPQIQQLGRDHRKLGVRPVHYRAFADALMQALREHAGSAWRAEYEEAWLRLFWFTARLMIDSWQSATFELPYYDATVTSHQRRRPDIAVLHVRTNQPYSFQAGQHAAVESPLLPHTWRSYSMANPPAQFLEFHVRATGGGGVSDALVYRTDVGDRLRLGPARGSLTLDAAGDDGLLLVAGGTGLAPIKSLLGELRGWTSPPETWLFYGARSEADLYDLEYLTQYARHAPWLRLVTAVSGSGATGSGQGRYEPGTLPEVLRRYGPWPGHTAYLSGPPAMIAEILDRGRELGIPPERALHDAQWDPAGSAGSSGP